MGDHIDGNLELLVGKRLLGYMPLDKEQYKVGEWDNAIALYIGKSASPKCYVLRSQNQDYSMYDHWILEESTYIDRNSNYKAIGEEIISVTDTSKEVKEWTEEKDQFWLSIRTKTKELRMGHHWNDCHYPHSIWGAYDEPSHRND